MQFRIRNIFLLLSISLIALFVSYCGNEHRQVPSDTSKSAGKDPWLGHNDTAKYVGINTCKQCHMDIYQSFIRTGMGQSFDSASPKKSAGKFEKHTVIYDKTSDFYYHPFWKENKYYIREFRLSKKDTVYNRVEQVSFIIGSGQHTNSHIFNVNGYLHQMPMTFYTQKGQWDLPPGFENGFNTRFSRKIGLECMSCHNAYPDFVAGSENKFNKVMNGIDCERCHGPGSVHVDRKQHGEKIDTSRYADYSIVNPGKLSIDRQFDVCMRCHLQGNAVLNPGKSFFDFKPGMRLADFITVFMPRYAGADDQFIMASHAARLKMSKCFIQSLKQVSSSSDSLRPYKNALTCVTCHNPHVSVKETGSGVFNAACMKCHSDQKSNGVCQAPLTERKKQNDNCVSCHMPRSGATDIPHVTVHDHYIRAIRPHADIAQVRKFIGLYAVNDDNPSRATKAKAYVNYYEKFDSKNPALLDSALYYLPSATSAEQKADFQGLVQVYFLKREYKRIAELTDKLGKDWVLNTCLVHKSLSNEDAWTAYRIGEACHALQKPEAYEFYKKATELAPFMLDFQGKMGVVLMEQQRTAEAEKMFDFIIREDNRIASAHTNRGRIWFMQGHYAEAKAEYERALLLDPDNLAAMKNQVDLLITRQAYPEAKALLNKILKKYPEDKNVKDLLEKMKSLKLISSL